MERIIHFRYDDVKVDLGMDITGDGPNLVLLPALSSISTRHEMDGLAQLLSGAFKVHTVDWPGFGNKPRPRTDWNPDILSAFVGFLLADVVPGPHAVVAAGHAAAYALSHAVRYPLDIKALVLTRSRTIAHIRMVTPASRSWPWAPY